MIMKNVYSNILESIGNTPLVRINKLNPYNELTMYAKLEGLNPSGSIKDRIALKMIEQAEMEGRLAAGKTIIEPTSGNTGIALAIIGVVKGYNVEIVMSEAVSMERRKLITSYGGKVILTDAASGTDGAIRRARQLVKDYPDKYFMPDQFSNEYNKLAHYKTTSEEIWEQTEGKINYLVSAIGTSGTIMGIGKFLKDKNHSIKIICAHPVRNHYIQGLKNMEEAMVPEIYDPSLIDETIMIESEDAFEMTRRIVRTEGISAGMSSGAAMYAALESARADKKGIMVIIFPDRAEKYLTTDLFGD